MVIVQCARKMHDSNLEYFMTQTLKIVMGQLNFLVGDIDGNTEIVIQSSSDSIDEHAADMILSLIHI